MLFRSEMPKELILEIVESYKTGAKLCKDCGFDMVQVHAAHGWLFSQFLSPVMNQRTDEFGGSLENRARFLMMALDAVREGLENETYKFYVGTSYRHLLIWDRGEVVELTQPHDVLGQTIGQYLPEDAVLREMMKKSYDILVNHPINVERKKKGLNPANSCWFWGAGTKPALSSFEEKTHLKGAMISAVDLLKGIAVGASMKVIEVEGANGGLNTNYEGKAQAAIDVLTKEGYDFAYIHVEAPDEMGHQGSVERKVKAIEYLDSRVIKPVKEGLEAAGEDFRMLVLPDHPTPICMRTHSSDSVPYLLYDSTDLQQHDWKYNEAEGESSGNYVACGHEIIDYLFGRKTC